MLSLYVTFPDKKSALRIARALVKEKLIACANIFPCTSIYEWKGKLGKHGEYAAIMKCSEKKWKKAERRILQLHPYDVPCITAHRETATEKYARWVEGK